MSDFMNMYNVKNLIQQPSLTGCSTKLEQKRFLEQHRPHFEFNSKSFNYSIPKEGSSGVLGERNFMQSSDMKYQFNKNFPPLIKKMLENLILAPIWVCQALIWATIFFEVLTLLDVRDYPQLQSCAIPRKTNNVNLRKWRKT